MLDRVTAQPPAGAGRKERVGWCAAAFGEPAPQHRDGQRCQRGDAFLAAFAEAVHVGADAEADVGDGEVDQFGDPQPGLDREDEQRVVPSPVRVARWQAPITASVSSSVR